MVQENERFRRDLAGVLDRWVSEDLVSADQARRLRTYYRLDALDAQASSRFVLAILVFGAVLVGLGVISFVAANWDLIPPAVRVLVATALMVGCDWAGVRLWTGDRHQRWGTVLLLVGTFLLGADIALVAQWFQVGGEGGGLFLGWGVGALAMAWGIRHAGVGAVGAGVLAGAGMMDAAVAWLPWAYALGVVPLALTTGSGVLLGLGLLGALGAVGYLAIYAGPAPFTIAVLAVAVGALGAAGLARRDPAWREALARLHGGAEAAGRGLEAVGERLAGAVVGMALLAWSFHAVWNERLVRITDEPPPFALPSAGAFALAALIAALVAAWRHPPLRPGLAATGAAAGLLAGLLAMGAAWNGDAQALALPENLVLAGFALWSAWQGLERADRNAFWYGLALLSIQVFARFMEFESGLLLKSLVFVVWGLGLIGVGLWFERVMARRREVAHVG